MIDAATFARMKSLNLDPQAYLANNDATGFFSQTGDLLLTGPTLTNVNDVRVILVD
jgi:hydroxypyruvate reductase